MITQLDRSQARAAARCKRSARCYKEHTLLLIQLPLSVAVGSLNPVKVGSARLALERAGFDSCFRVWRCLPAWPSSRSAWRRVARGARQRALNARAALGFAWGVGMEGGVEFDRAGDAWLFSVVAIITAERESLARGGQLLLPPRVARAAARGR